MWAEFQAQVPCSVALVRWPSGRFTVAVKIALRPASGASGPLRITDTPDVVSLDVADAAGALLYPSDFAPYKPMCDVLVVGAEMHQRAAEGFIAVGRAEKRVAVAATLGPRETFCPFGDPSDPAALRAWSAANADFSKFHAAPVDQRIPHARAPFTLQYRRGDAWMDTRFDGPEPTVRLVDSAVGSLVASVPLALDTILVAPREARVNLVFRGVAPWPSSPTHLVVDVEPGGARPGPRSFAGRVVEPSTLRIDRSRAPTPARVSNPSSVAPPAPPVAEAAPESAPMPSRTRADTRIASADAFRPPALPFGPPSSRPAPTQFLGATADTEDDPPLANPSGPVALPPAIPGATAVAPERAPARTAIAPRAKAFTLPFKRPGAAPAERRVPLDAAAFAELRRGAPAQQAWDGEATHPVPKDALFPNTALPPAEAPPPPLLAQLSHEPPEPVVAAPSVLPSTFADVARVAPPSSPPLPPPVYVPPMTSSPPVYARPPAAQAPPPPPPPPPPPAAPPSKLASVIAEPAVDDGPSDATMKAIQGEVWKGERPLAEILASHGLTEAKWREAKRAKSKR